MKKSGYRFVTIWRIAATAGEVASVLDDAESLVRWWPSVYYSVKLLDAGEPDGRGRRIALRTTGWLPYTLSWESRLDVPVTEAGFSFSAAGDFQGTGKWTFAQDGPEVELTFLWQVRVRKPLIRRLTWLLEPVFAANHRWAMRKGEESLRLEVRRRRADTSTLAGIPAPPKATFRPPRMRTAAP